MTYSDFTYPEVTEKLNLDMQVADLYGSVAPFDVRPDFCDTIARGLDCTLRIGNERARAEFLIAPILLELSRMLGPRFGIYSGFEFNVNRERGLAGYCDYILTRKWLPMKLTAPAVAIVEAKNDNIPAGLGQCIAEMVAAVEFNGKTEAQPRAIQGIVTTGTAWKFLVLDGGMLTIDSREHQIADLPRLMGILKHVVEAALGE